LIFGLCFFIIIARWANTSKTKVHSYLTVYREDFAAERRLAGTRTTRLTGTSAPASGGGSVKLESSSA
jgi:hypothetical protein